MSGSWTSQAAKPSERLPGKPLDISLASSFSPLASKYLTIQKTNYNDKERNFEVGNADYRVDSLGYSDSTGHHELHGHVVPHPI